MKEKKVSVIIINWNGKKYLELCLSTLALQSYKNLEVILVDNASKDNSVQYVKRNYKHIKVIKNSSNLGFAEANNIGFKNSTGDYILFLNNDTEVTRDFIKILVNKLETGKNLAGVQSRIQLMDDREKLDSIGAFLTINGFLYHYGIAKKFIPKYDKEIYVYSAKGACMMFTRYSINTVLVDGEMFDGRFFAYFEETDFCHRIWLKGYKIKFIPSSVIYHKMGGTSNKLPSPFIQFHSFKNRINSYIKNLELKSLLIIIPIHLVTIEMLAILYLIMFKPGLFFAVNKAIFWNITNLSDTLKKREYIQKNIRVKNDAELNKYIYKKVPLKYYLYLFLGLEKYEDN